MKYILLGIASIGVLFAFGWSLPDSDPVTVKGRIFYIFAIIGAIGCSLFMASQAAR